MTSETLAQFDLTAAWVSPDLIRSTLATADSRSGARGFRVALERRLAPGLTGYLDRRSAGRTVRLDVNPDGEVVITPT